MPLRRALEPDEIAQRPGASRAERRHQGQHRLSCRPGLALDEITARGERDAERGRHGLELATGDSGRPGQGSHIEGKPRRHADPRSTSSGEHRDLGRQVVRDHDPPRAQRVEAGQDLGNRRRRGRGIVDGLALRLDQGGERRPLSSLEEHRRRHRDDLVSSEIGSGGEDGRGHEAPTCERVRRRVVARGQAPPQLGQKIHGAHARMITAADGKPSAAVAADYFRYAMTTMAATIRPPASTKSHLFPKKPMTSSPFG